MTDKTKELEKNGEILSVTFDHENAHLASTHALQGGAANGWNTALLLKSDENQEELIKALEQVSVKLSMEEFLRKFFGMYSDDAEVLTKLFGYETEHEYHEKLEGDSEEEVQSYSDWYSEWLAEKVSKVTLLEKARDSLQDLTLDEKIKYLHLQASLEKSMEGMDVSEEAATETLEKNSVVGEALEASTEESEGLSSAIGSDNLDTEINKSEGEKISMTDKVDEVVVEKTAAELELEKAQAKLAELEKAAEKLAELEKAAQEKEMELEKAQAKLVEFEKAEAQRIEKGYENFAESVPFVAEKAEFVQFLMKARAADVESAATFIDYIEKAKEAILAAGAEQGFESDGAEEITKASHSALDDLIATKYAGKQNI